MKIKFILCVFIALVFCGVPVFAAAPTDLDMEMLTGKVKRIEEEIASTKLKKGVLVEDSRFSARNINFDKQGRMTYEWFKLGGFAPHEYFYTYEDEKRFRRQFFNNPLGVNPRKFPDQITVSVFRYDAAKNEIFEDVYADREANADALRQKYKYVFDEKNRLIEKTSGGANGIPAFTSKFIYGVERLPIERRGLMSDNSLSEVSKFVYELDEQGNWTKLTAETTPAKAGAEKTTVIFHRKITYYK